MEEDQDFRGRRQVDKVTHKSNRKPNLQWIESSIGSPMPEEAFIVGIQNGKNLYIGQTGNLLEGVVCGPLVEGEPLMASTGDESNPIKFMESYKVLVIPNHARTVHWVPATAKLEGTIPGGRINGRNILIGRVPYKRDKVTEWKVGMVSSPFQSDGTLVCHVPCKDDDFCSVDMYTVNVEILCLQPY
ncbi:unnamed protein product [Orchesella dallaii]|uniref:Uncharacterized protein n=1 Tax=Orchesella dallaii TaxID=48710 RepID=A0ABP1QNS3_9HEXA